ncbi:hypothetical protein QBZ16_002410 [Prototheca wickerhamii]|uniref:BING4 C-terminal domain-containing protein n=1 Tax=Prototheca wickerhamii TaxID=3111 RepID=A0AAD9IND2_PROWI|nr:hypothetical protein QBZ16_002410 [Prototheca wickerhamii]
MAVTGDEAPQSRPSKRAKTPVEEPEGLSKYLRGDAVSNARLKSKLQYTERLFKDAQRAAAAVDDWLLPAAAGSLEAEGMERTWRFQQADIVQAVESGAASKAFDLSLPTFAPYKLATTRSGRHLLMGGRRGHLALMDRYQQHVVCEVQVKESVHDVCMLHDESFFAAAQRKHIYIYDKRGIEIHCLKEHGGARALDFLPQHFLLTSVGDTGSLTWQDTSTGRIVAQARTRQGACGVLTHDPHTGVVLAHYGPVTAAAYAPGAARHTLVTAGMDRQVKVWDTRMMRAVHAYELPAPAAALAVSQRGLLAAGWGRRTLVWRDGLRARAPAPYLTHALPARGLASLAFAPYDDVLLAGHEGGVSAALVPGAGEPNYDSRVADPFQGAKARREGEVHRLLDKLQPEMIKERAALAAEANAARRERERRRTDARTPMKGKNKPSRRQKRKQLNIVEDRKPAVKERMRQQGVAGGAQRKAREPIPESVPRALHRFFKR